MKELENLINEFARLYDPRDLPPRADGGVLPASFKEAYEAAERVWAYPSYEDEVAGERARGAYVGALIQVAEYFQYALRRTRLSPEYPQRLVPAQVSLWAVGPLKRAYELDAGRTVPGADFSYKEIAAHKLGLLYKRARCHHSAVWWFRQALRLARTTGARDNILANVHQLAWNLETLGQYEEAGVYYEELLATLAMMPPTDQPLEWIVHVAMFHVLRGDAARGEAIMRPVISALLGGPPSAARAAPVPIYLYTALHSLAMHLIEAGRFQEALDLGWLVLHQLDRFEASRWVHDGTRGWMARAYTHMGQLDQALEELSAVYDVETTDFVSFPQVGQTIGLWIDIARIHTAHHRYERAIVAYEILAYHLGTLVGGREPADTTRLRFYWLQHMALVVHEMASVWLTIPDRQARQAFEAQVGNALLQLKANLFVAIEAHKNLRYDPGDELFEVNRSYAAAARRVANRPDDDEALLALEHALFAREEIERRSLQDAPWETRFESTLSQFASLSNLGDLESLLEKRGMGDFYRSHMELLAASSDRPRIRVDFRASPELDDDTLLLDYSLIQFRPPHRGLIGPVQGARYVGIRLSQGSLSLVDLGPAEEIDTLCRPLIRAMARRPDPDDTPERQVRPAGAEAGPEDVDLDRLAATVHDRLVAPFEPLGRSLLFSPDGILAALPFHALIRGERYLIEDREIVYCHSLLQKESLSFRLVGGSKGYKPPMNDTALLLGDPDYATAGLLPLPATKEEVEQVGTLLKTLKTEGGQGPVPIIYAGRHWGYADPSLRAGQELFDEVRVHTGPDATVSRVLEVEQPRILHVAAHGTFAHDQAQSSAVQQFTSAVQPFTSAGYYRQTEEMGALPLSQLDQALLGSTLMLAKGPRARGDPAEGGLLTALELASLNLLGCRAVVLSACETGAGVSEAGAGVLGFQYAILATFARAGVLSLWKVLDRETAAFMVDLYQGFAQHMRIRQGYLDAVRKQCRRDGRRVHPYYWAAFLFLDQEYVQA